MGWNNPLILTIDPFTSCPGHPSSGKSTRLLFKLRSSHWERIHRDFFKLRSSNHQRGPLGLNISIRGWFLLHPFWNNQKNMSQNGNLFFHKFWGRTVTKMIWWSHHLNIFCFKIDRFTLKKMDSFFRTDRNCVTTIVCLYFTTFWTCTKAHRLANTSMHGVVFWCVYSCRNKTFKMLFFCFLMKYTYLILWY